MKVLGWAVWDNKLQMHICVDGNLFHHLAKVPITRWKNRINEKVRHQEVMKTINNLGRDYNETK